MKDFIKKKFKISAFALISLFCLSAHGCYSDKLGLVLNDDNIIKILIGTWVGGSENGPWWDTNWAYRKEITLTEQASSGDLSDYQVKVDINNTNFDFSKANANGDDIRFIFNGGEIDYWIESYDSVGETASIWVEAINIPSGGTATIYIYYGNGAATAASDGEGTFFFYDDFKTDTIASGKWTVLSGTQWSVDTVNEQMVCNEVGDFFIQADTATINNVAVEVDIKLNDNNNWASPVARIQDVNNLYFAQLTKWEDDLDIWSYVGGMPNHLIDINKVYNITVWYHAKFEVYGNNLHAWADLDDVSTTDTNFASGYVGLHGGTEVTAPAAECYFKMFRVRKYASPEPTVSFGAEEAL